MSRHGVRVGQHIVLSVLWEQDGLTPGEVARRLGVAGTGRPRAAAMIPPPADTARSAPRVSR